MGNKMDKKYEERILSEWRFGGFFYGVRHLQFDANKGESILNYISSQEINNDEEYINFFKNTWEILYFLKAWEEKNISDGASEREYSYLFSRYFETIHEKINNYKN